MSKRPLSLRLAICCALLVSTAALAQVPASASAPPAAAATAAALPAQLADFDAYVADVLKTFKVPGIAVAIVKDGKVVLAKGYGVRELGASARVDADTLFAIASNTKAFTAAALEMLADEGKLDMDGRVVDYLPGFRMSDPYVTHEMRVRDLLAHRSGLSLGAGDLLYWPPTDYTTQDVVKRLAKVPIKNSFRAHYAYDNILFAVATRVIEQVSGESYADFIRNRIFKPVGMTSALIDMTGIRPGMDVATGHAPYNFKDVKPVPPMAWLNDPGAGGIYASVDDLAKWMNVQLASGKLPDGKQLFSEKAHAAMWSMLTPIPVRRSKNPELASLTPQFSGYGEGWLLSDYHGQKLAWHTGGWPGFVSRLTLVPGSDLGVVVLTNQQSGAAFNAITYRVLDAYLDAAHKTDWVAAYAKAVAKSDADADASWARHEAARDKNAKPSLPLAGYAGTYRDPWYGDLDVALQNGKLRLRFAHTKQLVGSMTPWQHDTFIVRWDDRSLNADAFVNFALDADGHVREMRIKPISPLTDFSFDFQDLRPVPVKAAGKQD
ncbi:MAG: serine hydrolase [Rhodanobacter sp.]|nr:MAG: serine hydrolase [Rhodanobacter sp.]TAM13622.1 MAG: serine hydrolase [Rhodanobacter sp.]TAM35625.1 MAG: serine hydrolase [Rhodanobacter sp.]